MRTTENFIKNEWTKTLEFYAGRIDDYSTRERFKSQTKDTSVSQIPELQAGTSVYLIQGNLYEWLITNFFCSRVAQKTNLVCDLARNSYERRLVIYHNLPREIFEKFYEIFHGEIFEDALNDENTFSLDVRDWDENTVKEKALRFQKETGVKLRVTGDTFRIYVNETVDAESLDETSFVRGQAEVEAQIRAKLEAMGAGTSMSKREYAQIAGRLARKFNIPFINALRLGHNENALKKHAESLQKAKQTLKAMPRKERNKFYHEIFNCGRARKRSALSSLDVYIGSADVNYMDFSDLLKK